VNASPIRVGLVEDQQRTREGLALLIDGTPGLVVRGSYGTMESALSAFENEPPDVCLCDIGLPGMSGIDGVRRLKALSPATQVLMLTVHADSDHVFEAVCAGACGYMLKDTPPARLVEAIRELHEGGAPMSPEIARKVVATFAKVPPARATDTDGSGELSPREIELLELFADGHGYKTAARALGLSIDTVRFHVRNVYAKLHVHSKSEAVMQALRRGIVR
jgi:DNA-binding NarL/FixJ family response regulator